MAEVMVLKDCECSLVYTIRERINKGLEGENLNENTLLGKTKQKSQTYSKGRNRKRKWMSREI